MNQKIALFLMCLFPYSGIAFDLSGEWIVDVKTTLEFNDDHIKLSNVRKNLLSCALPNSKLYFDRGSAAFIQDEHNCKSRGKGVKIEGVKNSFYYSTLYFNATLAVIKFYDNLSYERILLFNITKDNYLWFDDGDDDYALRYYYKKVSR